MDFYNLLGVRRTAPAEEIRAAFRRMAKRAHPDAHPNLSGEEKVVMHRQFIQLAHAYETLSDPTLRAAYDRKLRAGRARSSAGAAPRAHSSAGAAPRAKTSPGARPRRSQPPPPPPPEDSADLDGLMEDVQELLGKFGLDMRQQFGAMLDNALDWALSVFMDVVTALESDRAEGEKAAKREPPSQPPPRAKSSGAASSAEDPSREASSGAASSTEGRGGESPPSPPNLDDELAALKKQVRSSGDRKRGRAPTTESVEEALQQIKERAKKKP